MSSEAIIVGVCCLLLAITFYRFRSQLLILLGRLAKSQLRHEENLEYTDQDISPDIERELPIQSWLGLPNEKFIGRILLFVILSYLIFIIFSSFSRALVQLGNVEFSAGYEKLGLASYSLALEFNEGLKDAINKCDAYNTQQQYELAISSCSKAIEIDPDYADAYFQRGYTYLNMKKYDEAIANFTKDIELIPFATRSYIDRGIIYTARNKYDLAIADFTKAIEIDSSEKRAWLNRGLAYISQGKNDLAIADCGKAIEVDDTYSTAYSCLGQVFSRQENYDLALANFDKAIKLETRNSDLYLSRGIIHAGQKNYDLAIADFDKAIEIAPTFVDAYIWRGNAFADTKNFSQAITNYQKAVSITHDSTALSYAYCVQGITYTKMGDFESAIPSLEEGIKLDLSNENSWCKTALENARQGIPTP